MPITLVPCLACKRSVEVEVPQSFLAAGLDRSAVPAACPDCAAKEHLSGGGLLIELASPPPEAVFPLGRVAITSGAVAALADARQHVHEFLERHARGDWGSIGHIDRTVVTQGEIEQGELATDESAKLNTIALLTRRGQVMSTYRTGKCADLWVVTTLGNHETVVMLPREY
jgi:hypothetical protein